MARITINTVILLLGSAFAVSDAQAATARLDNVKVVKVLVADEGRWGGCMALLDTNIASSGLDCPSRWLSFSCSGDFTSKDVASKMFDVAQMALALDRRVEIYADDHLKHNGYCYANRIDVMKD